MQSMCQHNILIFQYKRTEFINNRSKKMSRYRIPVFIKVNVVWKSDTQMISLKSSSQVTCNPQNIARSLALILVLWQTLHNISNPTTNRVFSKTPKTWSARVTNWITININYIHIIWRGANNRSPRRDRRRTTKNLFVES
jgi:hypothetical protein